MNTQNPKIKILISYHDKHPLIKSDILTPIQTGCALAKERFEGMLQDDDGDNISQLNPYFCELTAMYWAWKNYEKLGNPDYVGFMHYRRHFIFNDIPYTANQIGVIEFPEINEEYLSQCGLNDENITKSVINYDACVPTQIDLQKIWLLKENPGPKQAFCANAYLNPEDFDLMSNIITQKYPHLAKKYQQYLNGHMDYWYTVGIWKKDLFFKLCEFVFPILFEIKKRTDHSNSCKNGKRTVGYLGERVISFFISLLKEQNSYHIKELPLSFVCQTEIAAEEILPVFQENEVAVVLSSSERYVPYLAVTLQSIVEHADPKRNYDICILTKDISQSQQQILKIYYERDNVSLRFVSMKNFSNSYRQTKDITIETYFRIWVPRIFKKFRKIVFLDSDLVVLDDLALLYDIDLKTYPIAAVDDYTLKCFLNNYHRHDRAYFKKLGIKKMNSLFNAGVLVWNMPYVKADVVEILEKLLEERTYTFFDQDVLNLYFNQNYYSLPLIYNFTPITYNQEIFAFCPESAKIYYEQAMKKAKIVHYNSPIKPWRNRNCFLGFFWWKYARNSLYYEKLVCPPINPSVPVFVGKGPYYFAYCSYLYYKFISHCAFGKRKEIYKKKYRDIRTYIKEVYGR